MVNSLDFIRYAWNHTPEMQMIEDALSSDQPSELFIDRHKLTFDPSGQVVVVERASDEVFNAAKIWPCRMSYELFRRLMDRNFDGDDETGFEWL